MGRNKLRNGDTDVAKVTQWIGRKIRNHDIFAEIDVAKNERLGRKAGCDLGTPVDDPTTIFAVLQNGRRFAVSVREVPEDEPVPKLVAVGY